MLTVLKHIDENNIDYNILQDASNIIKNGGLVAFPTETVYGLGANALDPQSVSKIYNAKGRPSDNPLIVHISNLEMLSNISTDITPCAKKLIENFWPGALTLVLKKSDIIPLETTGGLGTVAVRFPSNKIARALIETANLPIAAPSANISGKPSPTKAKHVQNDLSGKIQMIIDGGNSVLGLESTVVDATGEYPTILRPGGITYDNLLKVCDTVFYDPALLQKPTENLIPKSPGQKYKHYSPNATITIVSGEKQNVANKIIELANSEKNVAVICVDSTKHYYENQKNITLISLGNSKTEIDSKLFDTLRLFDELNITKVYSETLNDDFNSAVMNRLIKASGYNILKI